ncbi:MAG: TonB-dependent receptor plug domain-containing protein [Marinicellaceae bacterium]
MKTNFNKRTALFLSMFAPLTIGFTSSAVAQEEGSEKDVEEVVVLGSRRAARSATDSAVPVDVIGGEDFVNQGATDLSTLLRNVVPSYNVNTQAIADAATLVRPANLRGLAPDHTLVLVNGKRRHRAAVISWLGNGVADGSQGPDISQIPAIALKQVAVLRDGAAAQYGSDAIAGVMNFVLNDSNEGASFEARYGEFYEGDGATYSIAGNAGFPFTDDGFFNVSFEYGETDETSRSVQRDDAQALIDAGNNAVADPAQVWGQPIIDNDLKLVYNMAVSLDEDREVYAFGNYGNKTVDGGFFFRNPNTRGGVFAGPGVTDVDPDTGVETFYPTILTGDLTPGALNNDACPIVRIIDNVPDQDALDDLAGANCFAFNQLFPGGFTPRFGGQVNDFATTVGLRGVRDDGLNYDFSASYGRSHVDFTIRNTVNASLGPQTPTSFNPGAYEQVDKNFNADFSFPVSTEMFHSDLNVAFGGEYRSETFTVTAGDQASFEIGPLAAQGFSSASNGFPGFSNLAAGEFERSNFAAYIDLEADITERLLMGVATRFEDFADFGTTLNSKLTGRFEITDSFALRGAWSTGFRAPTPGQSNAFNVSTQFEDGMLVNNGTIPSTNPVAVSRGGKALEPEESTNYTLGAVFNVGPVDFTIDFFKIDLDDRLTLSQNNSLSQEEIDGLIASGVTSAANLRNFRFFTNGYDTETEGVDIVATYSVELGGGNTDFVLSFNHTETEVVSVDTFINEEGQPEPLLGAERILEQERGLPETRWNFSANHTLGDWSFLGRISHYSGIYDTGDNFFVGDNMILDAEVSYDFSDSYRVTLGAQNITDEYPDVNPFAASGAGNAYGQASPAGFGGGFYYLRFRYDL